MQEHIEEVTVGGSTYKVTLTERDNSEGKTVWDYDFVSKQVIKGRPYPKPYREINFETRREAMEAARLKISIYR